MARLTPIDALRYTEQTSGKRKNRATHGSKISKLAYANLGRNRIKTILVILSLALTVVLLNCVVSFAGGFDMEKYLNKKSVKDFVVGSADYFKCNGSGTGISVDSEDEISEKSTDKWLAGYTANDSNGLNYESKEQLRKEFTNFKNTFLLVGMSLCFIVGLVGILNYFNAILTGIMTRRREFAMLQSVGMTWRQLKKMLILEGVYYAIGAGILSILIAMIISPLLGNLLETVFWFFSYRFVIWPVFAIIPVFLLLGIILPVVIYHFAERQTIVERLRETEYSAKRLLNLREKMLDFMITL